MKKLTFAATLSLLIIFFSISLAAAKVEVEGKAWLDAQKDAPAMNVNGAWESEEWGAFLLTQTEGSRDVTGKGGGYDITGVVSGKRLFMLFATKHTVDYCATVTANGDNKLTGTYSDRKSRLKSGLCQESSRPMIMTKK